LIRDEFSLRFGFGRGGVGGMIVALESLAKFDLIRVKGVQL